MAQLKTTKVFGDLNVTGEVNASTKITVNGEEVWDTGNLLNIGTTAATARTALGLGAGATRWPTFAEVTGKPSTYAPSGHTHPWTQVTDKPATYAPSGHTHPWAQVTGQPATATRWPSWAEVTGKPDIVNSAWPIGSCYTQFPTTPTPASLFGGTWKLLFNTEGTFFRTEGGGAQAFDTAAAQEQTLGSHSHTATSNNTGAHTHTVTGSVASGGAHTHSISGTAASAGAHTHTSYGYRIVSNGGDTGWMSGLNGKYDRGAATSSAGAHTHSISGTAASAGAHGHTFSGGAAASAGGHAHVITVAAAGEAENKPKNRTIRVWQRTA